MTESVFLHSKTIWDAVWEVILLLTSGNYLQKFSHKLAKAAKSPSLGLNKKKTYKNQCHKMDTFLHVVPSNTKNKENVIYICTPLAAQFPRHVHNFLRQRLTWLAESHSSWHEMRSELEKTWANWRNLSPTVVCMPQRLPRRFQCIAKCAEIYVPVRSLSRIAPTCSTESGEKEIKRLDSSSSSSSFSSSSLRFYLSSPHVCTHVLALAHPLMSSP